MSVTGHRDVRLADDSYATPESAVRLLLPHLQRGDVLEPCCGEGAIAKVIHENWNGLGDFVVIHGVELDPERAKTALESGYFDTVETGSFFDSPACKAPRGSGDVHKWPLIITNPPFSLALEFVQASLKCADTVAMLLRLAWLASAERSDFHRDNPSDLIVLAKRPSFAKFVSCGARVITQLPPCEWKQSYKPSEAHPKRCPLCDATVTVSSSDSADYGWFIWGPGRGGRIIHSPIDVEQVHREFEGAAAQLEELTR